MTLTELRYIVTLARERHFGRAAEKCHVSQPTLSVALKKVEQRFGIVLFERSSAEVRLTPLGEQIAWQAERVLEESARLKEIAGQGKDPLSGTLRLGVIVADPFTEPGVVTNPLYDEPFRIVLPAGHPLAAQETIPPEAIAGEQLLLLGQGNCFRDQVVQACPKLSEPGGVNGSLEGSSLETVRHMVASGAGISVVPISAAESWPRDETLIEFRRFTDPAPFRRVLLAWRVTFPRPQAIDALRAAILAALPPGAEALRSR